MRNSAAKSLHETIDRPGDPTYEPNNLFKEMSE